MLCDQLFIRPDMQHASAEGAPLSPLVFTVDAYAEVIVEFGSFKIIGRVLGLMLPPL